MTTEPKSKFIVFADEQVKLNPKIEPENNRPRFKGELARSDGTPNIVALWRTRDKNGKNILSGTVTTKSTMAALRQDDSAEVQQPAGLSLKLGQIVLFENAKDGNAKRPDFYGYSHTVDGINRHSVWETNDGSHQLRGSTEAWTPTAAVNADPDTGEGRPTSAKGGVKQAHTAKR